MKHWQETKAVFDRLAVLTRQGATAALSVIVGLEGSSYRRKGAKLLVCADGTTVGNVSGGCLEEDLKRVAREVLDSGRARKVHYDTGGDEDGIWGFGLGCGGSIDLVVLPVTPALQDVVARVAGRLAGDTSFSLALGIGEDDRAVLRMDPDTAEAGELFRDVLAPPPRLLVLGAGDDAVPLIRQGAEVGLRVVVVDHRPAYLDALPEGTERLAGRAGDDLALPALANTYAVVKTHAYRADLDWVTRLMQTPVPYVGLLGPVARCRKIAAELPPGDRERLYGPVGLDLGGEGPEQVAMSIVAEILAVRAGRVPGHLKDGKQPIHASKEPPSRR